MSHKKVYLAGPIAGLSYEEARWGWRERIAAHVDQDKIKLYSPMRFKEFLKNEKSLNSLPDTYNHNPLSSTKGIFSRDHNDVKTSDAVVFYLKSAKSVSIGTCFEIAWTNQYRIPSVLIIEKDGIMEDGSLNPHWHAFIKEAANYIVEDTEEAGHILTTILTPGL